tara:strand:+ start:514 stop:1119 length:606 start_codon:yes stop_codon:yes gene_type:complete
MKGFKQCEKGHFYKEDKKDCPYCPENTKSDNINTEFLDETKAVTNDESLKTQVFGEQNSSKIKNSTNENSDVSFDPTKTMIVGSGEKNEGESKNSISRRRLRGWLVSFDVEEFGVDFKILEGRNMIGSKSSNDITIQDPQVSSIHALVLCKKDKFLITDEMSSNGTSINDEDLSPREPYDLNDGDTIKIGNTSLLFRKAFK